MSISQIEFVKIVEKLSLKEDTSDYYKIKQSVEIVNVAFLKIAVNQLSHLLNSSDNNHDNNNLFDRLMKLYNKIIREHQMMYLLLHIIETTLRSKAASVISKKFSKTDHDDWWHDIKNIDNKLIEPVMLGLKSVHRHNDNINSISTYDFFDSITFNQLLSIYDDFWNDFKEFFVNKQYKRHSLPALNKTQFTSQLKHIKNARNDIAHHKPINHSQGRTRQDLIYDIELILCHLGFNLNDAVRNIDPTHSILKLKYC